MKTTIDRIGTFRVISTEHGLGKTRKAGHPQFNIQTTVTAIYDEENETWVDWSEYGQEIGVRQCLFGVEKKSGQVKTTLSYDQVEKVFKWDGVDLQVLAELPPGVEFQVRVVDNDPDYADKNPYQVDWVDEFDADPSQKIEKCSKEEIDGLQAKYAALLKAKATPPKPAAAKKAASKASKKKVGPKAPPKVPEPGVITKKDKPAPPAPTVPAPAEVATSQVDNYNKAQAWGDVVELKGPDVTDDQLQQAWQGSITDVSNGAGENMLNGPGWWKVKDRTLNAIGGL